MEQTQINYTNYNSIGRSRQNIRKTSGKESSMLMFKINYEKEIIFYNSPAMPVLMKWRSLADKKIPEHVLENHPEIFNKNADSFCELFVGYGDNTIRFTVVPFPESEYIGFYGEYVTVWNLC